MSINPDKWGKDGWRFLHFVSLGYPDYPTEIQKEQYKNFFYSIKYVLPCRKCSEHYTENLNKYPLSDDILSNKNKIINWVIDIHNEVNKINNKNIVNYDDAIKYHIVDYNEHKNIHKEYQIKKCKKKREPNLLFIFIIILFILITITMMYKKINSI
jgi:hypothetical protein